MCTAWMGAGIDTCSGWRPRWPLDRIVVCRGLGLRDDDDRLRRLSRLHGRGNDAGWGAMSVDHDRRGCWRHGSAAEVGWPSGGLCIRSSSESISSICKQNKLASNTRTTLWPIVKCINSGLGINPPTWPRSRSTLPRDPGQGQPSHVAPVIVNPQLNKSNGKIQSERSKGFLQICQKRKSIF